MAGCPGAYSCAKRSMAVMVCPPRCCSKHVCRRSNRWTCQPRPSLRVGSCIILMEYGDIPNCMTRTAATGDESPCQAVRPPTGRDSGSNPYLPTCPGSFRTLSAEPQDWSLRTVPQLATFPYLQPIFLLSQSSLSTLSCCNLGRSYCLRARRPRPLCLTVFKKGLPVSLFLSLLWQRLFEKPQMHMQI